MSESNHATESHDANHAPTMHDVDKPMAILVVFLIVFGLSAANIGLSIAGLGKLALPVQMGIGVVQACIVANYWMHMRRKDTVVTLTALTALFFMFIMFMLTIPDYLTRQFSSM